MYDLGLPAQRPGAPQSTLIPVPYAINQSGDVALTLCPPPYCGAALLTTPVSAYVYDYRHGTVVRLATLPAQSNVAQVDQYAPYALNNRGQIVGAVVRYGKNSGTFPVIWTRRGVNGSTIAHLDAVPSDQGAAHGINDSGITVGSMYAANGYGTAVRFTGGTPVLLGANAGGYSDAFGINNAGVAVGAAFDGAAVTFLGGVATMIPPQYQCPPPFDICDLNLAVAINGTGDVLGNYVGTYFDMADQTYAGFLWKNNAFTTLAPYCFDTVCPVQFQHGDSSYVLAMNDNDDFVGYFDGQPWLSFAPQGDANSLLPPNSGWQIINVVAINNRRQITGQAYRAGYGGAIRAFLLEPPL